ncbi:septum site-determining protein Ssd [Corynebacterium qintianiae]|uniref:septum site-determining protein Ssd n=1 Tax=Corynebacterium qintianiae TaxID=2709392 RepID=UPI0013EA5B82|nr:septum site-determining protein Ssd [Corynebacterium qintianiae]
MAHTSPILIAVDDVTVHSEATHLAAAAGRAVVDAGTDPGAFQRHFDSSFAVLIDADAPAPLHNRSGIFVVGGDAAAIASQHAARPEAEAAFVLPAQAADLLRALGSMARSPGIPREEGKVVAVVGAAGGSGTSTLGASLCRARTQSHAPTLVDAHRYSGGIDLLLGIEERVGARWGDIAVGEGAIAREDIRRALPSTPDGIAVLTSSRTTIRDPFVLDTPALERTVAALGATGLTVVDCPARLVPQRCDLAVIVTPGEVRAAAAAARIAAELAAQSVPGVIVARRRTWSGLTASDIERVTKVHVVAEVPDAPGLTRKVETGGLPRHLPRGIGRAAAQVLAEVGL